MLKTRIILVVASAIVIWLLFLLPKVVVENESQMGTASESIASRDPHTTAPAAIKESNNSLNAQY
jgi:hypothetical protein